jgi:dolichol-phosphate mannosyltransferase
MFTYYQKSALVARKDILWYRFYMISVVVAIYNEERIVEELAARLRTVFENTASDYEIVFVDDGSSDATSVLIEKLHRDNKRVKLIQFSRNFGQVAALRAGLAEVRGDRVITMDGDLQDVPEEIPNLLTKLEDGYDMVYAQREQRKHVWFRNTGSRIFAYALRWATVHGGVVPPDKDILALGVFRAMRRDVVDAINQLSEQSGYFQGLINWAGFRHGIVPVTHGARAAGHSHYSLRKLFRYGLEALVFLFPFPLRIFLVAGAAIAAISLPLMIMTSYLFFFALSFWTGVQLTAFGIAGEYICRALLETKHRPFFVVKKKLL